MERNHIIGFLLIFGLLILWMFVNSPSKEELSKMKERQDSLNQIEALPESPIPAAADTQDLQPSDSIRLHEDFGSFSTAAAGTSQIVKIENENFIVSFDTKGGKISDVELKEYKKVLLDENKKEYKVPLHLLDDQRNIWDVSVPAKTGDLHTGDLYFTPQIDGNKILFTAAGQNGERITQEYLLTDKPYEIQYKFAVDNSSGFLASGRTPRLTLINYMGKLEKNDDYERNYSTVYYKETSESVDYCSCRKSDEEDLSEQPVKWFSHSNQFFNTAMIAQEAFDGGVFETKMLQTEAEALKIASSVVGLPFTTGKTEANLTLYIGPNDFEYLRSYHVELEDIIPFGQSIFGTINRWVIRPVFNFLLGFIGSEGIVILVLTLLVKLALFPLSYKMLSSQAKMSALKPQLAHLKEKYKDDMQQQQMESMKIYREYGVNPLGGCFPVVLQMPVWFALYRFFPASIEFRQASFLWATDLSSYDVFVNLPFEIPYFGAHLSLLTLLWALSTIAYTYYNMQNMDIAAMNPALKYMQYFMPVMFLVFFNSYASGLTLYLLYSNLLNIGQTVGAKKFLFDEKKIMETLNVNKTKPKKKGGFQQRLEEAMKEQQRLAQSRQEKLKKKN